MISNHDTGLLLTQIGSTSYTSLYLIVPIWELYFCQQNDLRHPNSSWQNCPGDEMAAKWSSRAMEFLAISWYIRWVSLVSTCCADLFIAIYLVRLARKANVCAYRTSIHSNATRELLTASGEWVTTLPINADNKQFWQLRTPAPWVRSWTYGESALAFNSQRQGKGQGLQQSLDERSFSLEIFIYCHSLQILTSLSITVPQKRGEEGCHFILLRIHLFTLTYGQFVFVATTKMLRVKWRW